MISRDEGFRIASRFVREFLPDKQWYQAIEPDIKSVLFYGSVAKGTNRDDSDIDILIIVPLAVEKRHTAGEYFYAYEGYDINVVLRSIERLRKIVAERKDKFQQEVFRDSRIIFSADNEVKLLLQTISKI